MSELEAAWTELVGELQTRAPLSTRMIRPSRNDTGRVSRELGIDQAQDLDAWFALHDGTEPSLDGGQLLGDNFALGLQEAVAETREIRDTWADAEPGLSENTDGDVNTAGEVVGTWLGQYVMIGSDSMGGGWFIDLRPGPLHGCVRYWDNVAADDVNEDVWPSLTSLVHAVTSALRTGTPVGGYTARIVDGVLHWGDAE